MVKRLLRVVRALGTVRVRTTVGAVLAVGVVAVAGSFVLLREMRDALEDEVEQTAHLRAADMAAQLEAGTRPRDLPLDTGDDDDVVQVLESHARIVAFSPELEGESALAYPPPGEAVEVSVPFDEDPFVVVSATTSTVDEELGAMTVIVGRSLDTVDEPVEVMTSLLKVAVPLLLLFAALITWLVVGRALAPVAAMRREVDSISAAELHRRVPTPSGRDEIAGLAETMNRMLERLDESQARQRRFVSDASHELRSPVASIREHAEVALAHPDRTDLRDLAENVLAEDLRVQHLVDDLLLLARADEQSLSLRLAPVDVDDVVFEEADRLRSSADAAAAGAGRGNGLRVDTTAVSAARVSGDAGSLQRVVRNLTDNAARHAESVVSFTLAEADGHAVLTIDDDGPGIPEPDRERVFDRFVRLDESRARVGAGGTSAGTGAGAGLGLAIVAELVTAHGGTVTLTASPTGGTRATVTLPTPDTR